ncbi:hypothetical protein UFOVP978_11 [uncultured Caudovirales phage]|uniref:Uncharacterized protein n=1 Tax=uncultured Caudovirales phage TaxID=2100421 RepID=A0A6J5PWA5_9CAUD|nr:hypothetical protein UFOVP978_11 [uncultured Caudovirales phage]
MTFTVPEGEFYDKVTYNGEEEDFIDPDEFAAMLDDAIGEVSKGESAGHPFRGNQWTKGIPGGGVPQSGMPGATQETGGYVKAKYNGVEEAVALITSGVDGSPAMSRWRPDLPKSVLEHYFTSMEKDRQITGHNIATAQGFDGLPEIVSEERMNEEIAKGGTAIWSGGGSLTTRTEYESGTLFVTPGVNGSGRYFSTDPYEARTYVSMTEFNTDLWRSTETPIGSRMMSGALRADARVITVADLQKLVVEVTERVKEDPLFRKLAQTDHLGQSSERWIREHLSDMGNVAAALGYDAIVQDVYQAYGRFGYHVIVLNRTAVLISRHETWSNFLPPWRQDRPSDYSPPLAGFSGLLNLQKGESAGHPFRGNQYTGGIPGGIGGSRLVGQVLVEDVVNRSDYPTLPSDSDLEKKYGSTKADVLASLKRIIPGANLLGFEVEGPSDYLPALRCIVAGFELTSKLFPEAASHLKTISTTQFGVTLDGSGIDMRRSLAWTGFYDLESGNFNGEINLHGMMEGKYSRSRTETFATTVHEFGHLLHTYRVWSDPLIFSRVTDLSTHLQDDPRLRSALMKSKIHNPRAYASTNTSELAAEEFASHVLGPITGPRDVTGGISPWNESVMEYLTEVSEEAYLRLSKSLRPGNGLVSVDEHEPTSYASRYAAMHGEM